MSEVPDNPTAEATSNDAVAQPDAPPAPLSQSEWKSRIASAPGKDLLKLVQRDKPRASRLLSGFRAPRIRKEPVVLSRVAEEAVKQPMFASELAGLSGRTGAPPRPQCWGSRSGCRGHGFSYRVVGLWYTDDTPRTLRLPQHWGGGAPVRPDNRLREQIDKQRTALKKKKSALPRWEREAAQAKRELTTLRAELEAVRKAKESAESETANLRRRAEREAREKGVVSREKAVGDPKPVAAPLTAQPAYSLLTTPYSLPIEEALRRLLRRGKYAAVAEVCKEAIVGGGIKEAPAMARGAVHALYAAALYGSDEAERAAEQDGRAVESFLDAGAVVEATESFARLLSQATLLAPHWPKMRHSSDDWSRSPSGTISWHTSRRCSYAFASFRRRDSTCFWAHSIARWVSAARRSRRAFPRPRVTRATRAESVPTR
jgi:hypothetical protein